MQYRLVFLAILFLLLIPSLCLSAGLSSGEKRRIGSEAEEDFRVIIDLWNSGRFEELYGFGNRKSKLSFSEEKFVHQMKGKRWELAGSWERIRGMESDVRSRTSVFVRAKMGFRPKAGGDTKFVTETFSMTLEGGRWRTGLSKILSCPK